MDVVREADRIKDRLRACQTRDELEKVANDERATVLDMTKGKGFAPTMAIQIKNLKAYMVNVVGLR